MSCPPLLAIDPGTHTTGVACASSAGYQVWVVRVENHPNYYVRAAVMARAVLCLINEVRPLRIRIEKPGSWNTFKGRASLAAEAIQQVHAVVGALTSLLITRSDPVSIEYISPIRWKGTINKKLARDRLIARLGISGPPADMALDGWDALGLLLYLGEVKNTSDFGAARLTDLPGCSVDDFELIRSNKS